MVIMREAMGIVEFGKYFQTLRQSEGVKQDVIAQKLSIKQPTVSDLERGDRKKLTPEDVKKILQVLAEASGMDEARYEKILAEGMAAAGFTYTQKTFPEVSVATQDPERENCLRKLAPAGFENMPDEAHQEASQAAFQAFQTMYRMEMQRWHARQITAQVAPDVNADRAKLVREAPDPAQGFVDTTDIPPPGDFQRAVLPGLFPTAERERLLKEREDRLKNIESTDTD